MNARAPIFLLVMIFVTGLAFAGKHAGQRSRPARQSSPATTHVEGPSADEIREVQQRIEADFNRRLNEYCGTMINTNPDAGGEGAGLLVQKSIVEEFARQDPSPPHRLAHFAWLDDLQMPIRRNGWFGKIQDITKSREGEGWVVAVAVSPHFAPTLGNITTTTDYVIEMWLYSGGQLHYLEGIDPPDAIPSIGGD